MQRHSKLFGRNCAFCEESTKFGTMIYIILLAMFFDLVPLEMPTTLDFKMVTIKMAIVNRFSFTPAR